MTPWQNIGRYR